MQIFRNPFWKSDKLTVIDFWAEWCGPAVLLVLLLKNLQKIIQER